MADRLVRPGTRIVTGLKGDDRGVVGLIVRHREDNKVYALTAADLLVEGREVLRDGLVKQALGKPGKVGREHRYLDVHPVEALVGFIAATVANGLSNSPGEGLPDIKKAVTDGAALGAPVWKYVDGAAACGGRVAAIDVEFALGTGDARVEFEGALRVVPSGTTPFADPGDAGAPVLDEAGRIVGLVVALEGGSALICPLGGLLNEYGFEFFETPALIPMERVAARPTMQERSSREGASVRISGVNLPANKQMWVALTYIHGIGESSAREILARVNIRAERRCNTMSDQEILTIRETVDRDYTVEGDLRREVNANIQRLKDLGCYRGLRHRYGLPVRGQRTHTNARTRKGKAKAIAGKKK